MNTKLLILLVLQAPTACLWAQAVSDSPPDPSEKIRYQLILPEEKTPEVVKPNEPNPFNKGDGSLIKQDEATSEENRVKDSLLAMRATGIVKDSDGTTVRSVMLGDMKLERGMIVPPVVSDQEVHLRVNSLSDTTIELFWVEKKKHAGLPPRPVIIPINLEPSVRYIMYKAPPVEEMKIAGDKKSLGGFARQVTASGTSRIDPSAQESRRAVVVDETGTSGPAAVPAPGANLPSKQPPLDNHPANLLMNLLMNKGEPTQKSTK